MVLSIQEMQRRVRSPFYQRPQRLPPPPRGLTGQAYIDARLQQLLDSPGATYYQGGHDRSRRGTYRVNREGGSDVLLSRPGAQLPHLFDRRPPQRTEYRPGDAPISNPSGGGSPYSGRAVLNRALTSGRAADRTGKGGVSVPAPTPIKQLTPEEHAVRQQKIERLAEQSRAAREHRESWLEADRQYRAEEAQRRQQAIQRRQQAIRQQAMVGIAAQLYGFHGSGATESHENRQPTRVPLPLGVVPSVPGYGPQNSEKFIAGSGRARTPLPPPPQPPQSGGNDMIFQPFPAPGGGQQRTPQFQAGGPGGVVAANPGFAPNLNTGQRDRLQDWRQGRDAGIGREPVFQPFGGGQPQAQPAGGGLPPAPQGGFTGWQTAEQQQQSGPLGDIGRARTSGLAGGGQPDQRLGGLQPIPPGGGQPQPLPGGGFQRPATKPQPFADTPRPQQPAWPQNQGVPFEPPFGVGPNRQPQGQGAAQGGNMGGMSGGPQALGLPLPPGGGMSGGPQALGLPLPPGGIPTVPLPGGGQRPTVKLPPMDPRGGPPRPDMPGRSTPEPPQGGPQEPFQAAPTPGIYEPGQGAAQGGNMGGPPFSWPNPWGNQGGAPGPPATQGGGAITWPNPTMGGGPPGGPNDPLTGGSGPPVRPFPGMFPGGGMGQPPVRPFPGMFPGGGMGQPPVRPFLPPGYGQKPPSMNPPPGVGSTGPPPPSIPPWVMRTR